MEQSPNKDDETIRGHAKREFIQVLFVLKPDDELKARMWEEDPQTMSELMPEVGTDAFKVPKVPEWKITLGIARNTLRLCFDQWPKETRSPQKRMYDAWYGLHYTEGADS